MNVYVIINKHKWFLNMYLLTVCPFSIKMIDSIRKMVQSRHSSIVEHFCGYLDPLYLLITTTRNNDSNNIDYIIL